MNLGTFRSGKRRCLVLDVPVHRPVERLDLTLGYPGYIRQKLFCKKIVAIVCPIHFHTGLDKMDFSATIIINKLLFKRYV